MSLGDASWDARSVGDASAGASQAGASSGNGSEGSVSASDASEGGADGSSAGGRMFTHPGLLHTETDFARMRSKIAAGAQPWVAGYAALTSGPAQLGGAPAPLQAVVRGGTGSNYARMYEEMERTYQLALRWEISGDTAFADSAVQYLNAWSSTMKTLTGDADRFLAAGIYGYQWANAAEIMRTYPGWAVADVAQFQALLLDVFYPLSHDFLINHNGAVITNYWANWDLGSICGIVAIGVFCDRADLYDEAMTYYKAGRGNGAAAHSVYFLHPGYLGQWQESGRDQGHATLGISLAGSLCEMAYHQGDDLYGYSNNRFLAGAEYVAKSNLKDATGNFYSMPYSLYSNNQGTSTGVSPAGLPSLRPCWEIIANHYVNRKGLSAPWCATMAAQIRPEGYDGTGDDPGLGTLTHTLDPIAEGAAPSGLTAYVVGGTVLLSWWGSAYATSYNLKRGSSVQGPFTTLASVTDPRTFVDAPGSGVWFYVVTAVTAAGEGTPSAVARAALPSEMRAWLPLDASSGTTATDMSGLGYDGTLMGGATWGAGRNGGQALSLDGKSGYLAVAPDVVSDLGDFTIALWVYWNAAATNARVFDLGTSDIAYLALVPAGATGGMRFSVTGTTYFGEQSVAAASALPVGQWTHLAVTLSGTTGALYVNGQLAASSDAIALAPFQLGSTSQNWLGRSHYSADPYFDGRMQDLRIYSGALGAAEIAALAV